MASFSAVAAAVTSLCLPVWLLLISPAVSLNCTSPTLKSGKKFDSCIGLPTLAAHLHYSYNATNSSLSIAFLATPPKPEGWISWAINPTGDGMAGAQALLAYKSNNQVVVKTLNIASYSNLTVSKLSFETWDLSGEAIADGSLVIYGSMKVAEKAEKLNQVWQVGSQVTDGMPVKHETKPENVKAKDSLVLAKGVSGSAPGNGTSPSPPSTTPSSAPDKGGQTAIKANPLGLFLGLILFFSLLI